MVLKVCQKNISWLCHITNLIDFLYLWLEWSDFYEKSYRRVGRLVGGFYDQNGCPTQQVRFVDEQLEKASEENLDEQYENELYPSCNTEWNQNKKETSRLYAKTVCWLGKSSNCLILFLIGFWCTKQSGGVQRDW